MKIVQEIIKKPAELSSKLATFKAPESDLLLAFGSVEHFLAPGFAAALHTAFPQAILFGCTTAGEITAAGVDDGTCTLTAIHFDKIVARCATTPLGEMEDSFAAGQRLGEQLAAPDLKVVLLFGPGVQINGSALVNGLSSRLGSELPITGGLAGDAGAFRQTFTLSPDGVSDRIVVAVGLHGDGLRLGHGSFGGWEAFGPARKVTRCAGNVLFELDGEPALDVYKRYLGEHAATLPASGLLFPFAMLGEEHNSTGLIRTILGIDEVAGSLTLAGEIIANGYLKLMHSSTEKLVNGAETAARSAATGQLAILVSCVGRKLVMGDRVDEEVEAVSEIFGKEAVLTGFYSYGEISPFAPAAACRLHNQTMTITSLSET